MSGVEHKEDKASASTAFYAAEAFYSDGHSLLSMEKFAPELLNAATEEEIEYICEKYGFEHSPHSPYGDPRIYGTGYRVNPWKFKKTDDFVPSYTSWMLELIKTINACRHLYSVCLPIVRGKSKNSVGEDLFNVLFSALIMYQQMVDEIRHNYGWMPWEDLRERRITYSRGSLPIFPLVKLFAEFQETEGMALQAKYGVLFNQTKKKQQHEYHYWKIPGVDSVAREALWKFTTNHRTEYDQYILNPNPDAIASMYLKILDDYLSFLCDDVHFKMDSASGRAMLVAPRINDALYLWVFTQLQGKAEHRACRMCGKLFVVGSQNSKLYCGCHTNSEIQYFNNKIRKKEKEFASVGEDQVT